MLIRTAVTAALIMTLNGCGGEGEAISGRSEAQPIKLAASVVQTDSSVVVIKGYRNNYSLRKEGKVVTITSKLDPGDVRVLQEPTLLKFFDKWVSFDVDGPAGQVYRLYQAAFNRKPDLEGLGFWIYAHETDPTATLLHISNDFLRSDEFTRMYGVSPTAEAFVTALYQNVLHRAPEQQGFEWWLAIVRGGHDRGNVLQGFSESDENKKNVNPGITNGFDYVPFHSTGPIIPKFSSYENKVEAGEVLGPQQMPSEVTSSNTVAFGDFFQDGSYSMVTHTLDYFVGNTTDPTRFGSIKFYKRDAEGKWIDNTSALLSETKGCLHPRKALVADFNADGKPDVFFACQGLDKPPYPGEQPHMLLSQLDGTYKNIQLPFTGFFHSASAVDFDGRGYADIFVTDTTVRHQPYFLRNNKDGSFSVDTYSIPTEFQQKAIFSAEMIDFDGDSKYDMWIGGNEPGSTVDGTAADNIASTIVINDGQNGFLSASTHVLPINVDYGLPLDIVYANGKIFLLRTNIGGGSENYGKSFYTTAAVQTIDLQTMKSSLVYTHSGLFSNGMMWANWLIPHKNAVVTMDAAFGITVH